MYQQTSYIGVVFTSDISNAGVRDRGWVWTVEQPGRAVTWLALGLGGPTVM